MILQTPVKNPATKFSLEPLDLMLSLGSCFADNFADNYRKLKLGVWGNPFGNIFNVASLYDVLSQTQTPYTTYFQLKRDEHYFDYRYHTEINGLSPESLQDKIETTNVSFVSYLKVSKCIIITLGTSWVYSLKTTNKIVANCHKQNASLFSKILLDENTQADYLQKTIVLLRKLNPNLQIILTVSPVRHIKDGLPENAVSKAILRLICHRAEQEYDFVHYFPAYEILLDELRDYRFYAEDLIHPSKTAIEYILNRFEEVYFSPAFRENVKKRMEIHTSLQHRPLNPQSKAHLLFLEKLEEEINAIGWIK